MRRFLLVRNEDVTGVSGVGPVVWGIQYPDGVCAYRWNSPHRTTCVADSIQDIEAIHGHGGATQVVWVDSPTDGARWAELHGPGAYGRPAS